MSFTTLRICLGSPLPGNVRSLADSSPRKLCSKRGDRTLTLYILQYSPQDRETLNQFSPNSERDSITAVTALHLGQCLTNGIDIKGTNSEDTVS